MPRFPAVVKRNGVWLLLLGIFLFALSTLHFPKKERKRRVIDSHLLEDMYSQEEFESPLFRVFTKDEHTEVSKETRHVAFLKVHKSGSTTAQNMFLRFGWTRNLTFILPPAKNPFGYPNIISLKDPLTKNNTLPPPKGKHFEIMCNHVLYNHDSWKSFLPNDTIYIGVLREPYEQFKSTLNYLRPGYIFKLKSRLPGSEYLKNPMKYEPKRSPVASFTNNRMAVEFGFPDEIVRTQRKDDTLKYLKVLNEDFKLVIIAEFFEESILLMKRLLNWTTKDILYLDKNIAVKKNVSTYMGPFDRQEYKRWAKLDFALYDFFFKRLREQIRAEGTDFDEELLHFKEIRKMVSEFCKQNPFKAGSLLMVQQSRWSSAFTVDKEDCDQLVRGEIDFVQRIRLRQYGSTTI